MASDADLQALSCTVMIDAPLIRPVLDEIADEWTIMILTVHGGTRRNSPFTGHSTCFNHSRSANAQDRALGHWHSGNGKIAQHSTKASLTVGSPFNRVSDRDYCNRLMVTGSARTPSNHPAANATVPAATIIRSRSL
ncbi:MULTISPECIES: hypothetical protein [Sphingomonas]|jgi:hypothetical protein|uniref:hypothetical protein n=1 Tax=Sphingomonas TaxID=13687 RepID=UPI000AC901E0|nr:MULTISPECIES: hypothetical protein [Sphingomonas]WCP70861.1 hypothetical protein PPZ50_10780 [Sphingomonas hankookensis]